MVVRRCTFVFLLLATFSFFPGFAWSADEEAAGQAAEKAGRFREALTHYVAALQSASEGSADDQRLRETIIKIVQKLSPPPALPEEARRFSVRGQTWIKEAKNPSDFDEAAKEFGNALRAAPWWADGYINQAVALEKAGRFSRAIRSLKFYLLAAPSAPDADKVKEQIYALEVRQEKAQKERAARKEEQDRKRQEDEAKKTRISNFAGYWRDSWGNRYLFKVDGSSFTVTQVMACWTPPSQNWGTCPDLRPCNTSYLFGTVNNDRLSGYAVNMVNHTSRRVIDRDGNRACPVFAGNYPIIRSEFSADGTRLKMNWAFTSANPNCPPMEVNVEFGGDTFRREQ